MSFYDGTKLLSMKDINGQRPEIFISTSNRSAGKTTYFGKMVFNKFVKKKEKFILLYRYKYELSNVSEKYFKQLKELFFHSYSMMDKPVANNVFRELFTSSHPKQEPVSCGYAVAINSADSIKKYSHLLSDATSIIFDEFQSETNSYAEDEVTKFISLHTSLARGGGKQVRYLPVYMISNPVTLLNPYYTELGISHRIQSNTKFLKGDGFVLEQGFNESASKAQQESAFNRAFSSNKYIDYSSQAVYLNDNKVFIDKPKGNSRYICTLIYKGKHFAVREYYEDGLLYCDTSVDVNYPYKIAVTTSDHDINRCMLKSPNNIGTILMLRNYFESGLFRFKNLEAKECLMVAISY